jgi:sulfopyruvate decarboxylase subunit beta
MKRDDVLKILIAACKEAKALTVATMQATPAWHAIDPDMPLHVDLLGCMGSASSFGLGIALGAPDRPIVIVDGDGCLMMQLGSLVTIAHARAANLTLIVMNNGLYETSGNQRVPGANLADFASLAKGAGFARATRIDDLDNLRRHAAELTSVGGPTMLVLDIDREEPCDAWPALSMKDQIENVRSAFQHLA